MRPGAKATDQPPDPTAGAPVLDSYEVFKVKPGSLLRLPQIVSSLSWRGRRLVLPGRNAFRIGRAPVPVPNSYPGGCQRRGASPIPLAAGTAFRRWGPTLPFRGVLILSTLKRDELIREGRQDEVESMVQAGKETQSELLSAD